VLAVSGLGLLISNRARSIQQAMFMMFFFIVTMIFLGGLYTPTASMPDWAQTISTFLPLKYFIIVMRAVYLKGSDTAALTGPLIALACFAVVLNTLAIISYRKRS
jgi:ABC-2 type transport system permease protein